MSVASDAAWCRWAIEYEDPAADAFKLNHPHAAVFAANCNVILAAAMSKGGQQAFCAASDQVPACKSMRCGTAYVLLLKHATWCPDWRLHVTASDSSSASQPLRTMALRTASPASKLSALRA